MEKRTLSDADVNAIATAVAKHHTCTLGISLEDASDLCEFARWLRKLKNAIGNVVIYGFILVLALLFYMGAGFRR